MNDVTYLAVNARFADHHRDDLRNATDPLLQRLYLNWQRCEQHLFTFSVEDAAKVGQAYFAKHAQRLLAWERHSFTADEILNLPCFVYVSVFRADTWRRLNNTACPYHLLPQVVPQVASQAPST